MNRSRYNKKSRQEVSKIDTPIQNRYRRSRIRTGILDYLRSTDTHPSAEEVHLAVKSGHPKVSFGTVYRNLNILVDQGEARRLESSRGRDRFDARQPFHAHFHCEECGGLYDLPLEDDAQTAAKTIEEQTGHRILAQQVEFFGVCATCIISD